MSGTIAATAVATTSEARRPGDGILDVDHAWMSARAQDWDDLVGRAQNPTPFFSRHAVDAHVRHGIAPAPRFATAWRGGRLVGLWPYRRGLIGPVPGRIAWGSRFVTSSTPLVAHDAMDDNLGLLLTACGTIGGPWLLPRLTLDDAVGASLMRHLAERNWPSATLDPFLRPVLDRRPSLAVFEAGLAAGRRKDLRRRRRRLRELGTVTAHSADRGTALKAGIEAFLALELQGWKGRRGTALGSKPATAAFARAFLGSEAGPVRGRVDLLCLDERPVAASLALVAGRTAYLLKTAYDEALARHAPGVLLEDEIIRALHETEFADRLDSATEPGSPLDDLHPDRSRIGDVMFSTGPGIAFDAAVAGERLRRATREQLKRTAEVMRRMRPG